MHTEIDKNIFFKHGAIKIDYFNDDPDVWFFLQSNIKIKLYIYIIQKENLLIY